jgi:hypothetical protein
MEGFVSGAKVFFLALKEKHVGLSEFLYNFWLVTFSKCMIHNEKVCILECHVVQFSKISFLCPLERFIQHAGAHVFLMGTMPPEELRNC